MNPRIPGAAVAVAALFLFSGCEAAQSMLAGKTDVAKKEAAAVAATPEVLIPVEAHKPGRRSISDYFETTSRIFAERRVEVVSKGIGQCLEVTVEEGQTVTEGQVLARLDRKELEAQIRQTRITVEMNQYHMKKAKEQQEKGILSSFESDNARFAFEQAQSTLDLQQLQLEHQDILAPISGVITQRTIQRGMVVASGMPCFTIVDPSSYMLPIAPPEKEVQGLREGQRADVTVDSAPGKTFSVNVRRINPSVDPASGTVRVILDFAPEDRPLLKDSAFARVNLVMDTRENVLAVSKDVLVEENGRKYLMLLHQENAAPGAPQPPADKERYVAERVEVKTGLEDSTFVEVQSGLKDDDLVVTLGQHSLKTGAAVAITNAKDEVMANINKPAAEAIAESQRQQEQEANQQQGKAAGSDTKK